MVPPEQQIMDRETIQEKIDEKAEEYAIQNDLLCPISRELMLEPVYVNLEYPTPHSYEHRKPSIYDKISIVILFNLYFSVNQPRLRTLLDPLTKLKIHDTKLINHYEKQKEIEQFVKENKDATLVKDYLKAKSLNKKSLLKILHSIRDYIYSNCGEIIKSISGGIAGGIITCVINASTLLLTPLTLYDTNGNFIDPIDNEISNNYLRTGTVICLPGCIYGCLFGPKKVYNVLFDGGKKNNTKRVKNKTKRVKNKTNKNIKNKTNKNIKNKTKRVKNKTKRVKNKYY